MEKLKSAQLMSKARTGVNKPLPESFGLLYDVVRWEEKAILAASKKKGLQLNMIDARNLYLQVDDDGDDAAWIGSTVLQRCVSYFRSLHLTGILENKGIHVINNLSSAQTCGNKLFSTLALRKAGVPTPRTMAAFSSGSAFKALDNLKYPAVLKPVMGSWGRLVAPLNDPESATAIIEDREQMSSLYQIYYIQKRVNRPPRDIRSFVIGDQFVTAIYRYSAPKEWRTNTARGGKAEPCPRTKELEELSLQAAKAVGGEIIGVDCMETPEGLVVHEVNNTIEFKNTVPVTGVDIPGIIVGYMLSSAKK